MEVKVSYNKVQLEEAVRFIAQNNENFIGRHEYIKKRILSMIFESANKFPHCPTMSTMGFTIWATDLDEERMDNDENTVYYEVLVDPGLGSAIYEEDEYHIEVIDTSNKKEIEDEQ